MFSFKESTRNEHCVHFLLIPEVCSNDLVAALTNLKGWSGMRVIMCSAYLDGEKDNPTGVLFTGTKGRPCLSNHHL